jgi:predicted Zn-dependent protease
MSLINQMLRDLEQRNSQPVKPVLAQEVRRVAPHRRKKRYLLWLTLLLIALFCVSVWRQNQMEKSSQQPMTVSNPVVVEVQKTPLEISQPPDVLQLPQHSADVLPIKLPEFKQKIVEKPQLIRINSETMPGKNKSEKTKSKLLPVTKGRSEQIASLYSQAQRSDSVLLARELLEQLLLLDPLYLPARTLLLQNLLQSHASDNELSAMVDSSLVLFPGNLLFIKTRAHLYVKEKNFIAANAVLRQVDANIINDSAYLALLAASYEQLQNISLAAPLYRRLTEMQPEKAENWLGLAICAERLNQIPIAVEAYRQALDKNTLHGEVVNYINQRLSLLN